MVSVRKRGKVYEYRFETASVDGTRKWITKSGFPTKQDALNQGALDYNEYYRIGRVRKNKDMSYSDYLDYWINTYCNFNLKYSTIVTYLNIIKLLNYSPLTTILRPCMLMFISIASLMSARAYLWVRSSSTGRPSF